MAFFLNGRLSGETRISKREAQPIVPFLHVAKPEMLVRINIVNVNIVSHDVSRITATSAQ